jgi:hypothetical protein
MIKVGASSLFVRELYRQKVVDVPKHRGTALPIALGSEASCFLQTNYGLNKDGSCVRFTQLKYIHVSFYVRPLPCQFEINNYKYINQLPSR